MQTGAEYDKKELIVNEINTNENVSSLAAEPEIVTIRRLENSDRLSNRVTISRGRAALEIFKLSGPLMLSRGVTIAQGFFSTLIIAQINEETLAASSLFNTLQAVLTSTAMSSTYSVSVFVAEACGQENRPLAGRILNQGWVYAAIISIPTVGIALASRPIFLLLGQSANYAQISQDYFFAASASIPGNILLVCSQQFADATKRPIIDFITTIINTGLSLGLGYCLALGKFGLKPLNVVGLGIASSASAWLTFAGLLFYYKFSSSYQNYDIYRNQIRETLYILKKLIQVGVPIGVKSLLEMSAFFMANIMVGWIDQDSMVAQQCANQYLLLFSSVYMSIAIATSILVSEEVGENDFLSARRLGYTGLCLSTGITSVCSLACVVVPKILLSPLINENDPANEHIVSLAKDLLIVHAIDLLLDNVRNVSSGALMGIFDTQSPLFASIIALLAIATPGGYLFGFPLGWGLLGIYIARDIGVMLSAIYLLNKWRYQSREAVESGQLSNDVGIFTRCYNALPSVTTFFRSENRPVLQPASIGEITPLTQPNMILEATSKESFVLN